MSSTYRTQNPTLTESAHLSPATLRHHDHDDDDDDDRRLPKTS